jgi:hypothetical protein
MLRWVLQRGDESVTCQIDAHANRSAFDVSLVPHGDVNAGAIEVVPSPAQALQRHAEIAMQLRNAGWSVTSRIVGIA